jgi:CheY-like chemotaxis protein
MHVLLIDDSDLTRLSMARVLIAAGFQVTELDSPIGATNAILRYGVDAVVLDVDMPSMQGDKLASLIRRNPRLAHVKLVLSSGLDGPELAERGAVAGADATVSKSQGARTLAQVLKRLLRIAKSSRPPP